MKLELKNTLCTSLLTQTAVQSSTHSSDSPKKEERSSFNMTVNEILKQASLWLFPPPHQLHTAEDFSS